MGLLWALEKYSATAADAAVPDSRRSGCFRLAQSQDERAKRLQRPLHRTRRSARVEISMMQKLYAWWICNTETKIFRVHACLFIPMSS